VVVLLPGCGAQAGPAAPDVALGCRLAQG